MTIKTDAHIAPVGDIDTIDFLKDISTEDFLDLGVQHVAYVRTINIEGKTHYAIHAADGTPLSIMDDRNTALHTISQNDLEAVTVH